MSTYLIIGDVHGQLDALKDVIARAPEHQRRIYVGDLVDRGPQCIETLQFVMDDVKTNGAVCLYGNHEDMMVQALNVKSGRYGEVYLWLNNGGNPTHEGFKKLSESEQVEVLKFLLNMPLYVEGPGFICSHAPIAHHNVESLMSYLDRGAVGAKESFIWNRVGVRPWHNTMQFYGHNGSFKEHTDKNNDSKPFAYCVDNTRNGEVLAMHWPSMAVISKNFLGEENEETQAETETQVPSDFNDNF